MKMWVRHFALLIVLQQAIAYPYTFQTLNSSPLLPSTVNSPEHLSKVTFGVNMEKNLSPYSGATKINYNQPSTLTRDIQRYPNYKESENPLRLLRKGWNYLQMEDSQIDYRQDPEMALKQRSYQAVDRLISDRIEALQKFKENMNKILEDIVNIASTFVSKHSFFGGVTRRSILDPASLDDIKIISTDMKTIADDLSGLAKNALQDASTFVNYILNPRNIDIKSLLPNAFTIALRILTYQ